MLIFQPLPLLFLLPARKDRLHIHKYYAIMRYVIIGAHEHPHLRFCRIIKSFVSQRLLQRLLEAGHVYLILRNQSRQRIAVFPVYWAVEMSKRMYGSVDRDIHTKLPVTIDPRYGNHYDVVG